MRELGLPEPRPGRGPAACAPPRCAHWGPRSCHARNICAPERLWSATTNGSTSTGSTAQSRAGVARYALWPGHGPRRVTISACMPNLVAGCPDEEENSEHHPAGRASLSIQLRQSVQLAESGMYEQQLPCSRGSVDPGEWLISPPHPLPRPPHAPHPALARGTPHAEEDGQICAMCPVSVSDRSISVAVASSTPSSCIGNGRR